MEASCSYPVSSRFLPQPLPKASFALPPSPCPHPHNSQTDAHPLTIASHRSFPPSRQHPIGPTPSHDSIASVLPRLTITSHQFSTLPHDSIRIGPILLRDSIASVLLAAPCMHAAVSKPKSHCLHACAVPAVIRSPHPPFRVPSRRLSSPKKHPFRNG